MKRQRLKQILDSHEYAWVSTAVIAAVIVTIVLANVIVYRLAEKFEWYFYTEEQYSYQVDFNATDRLFASVDAADKVHIIFCQIEDDLTSSWETRLPYETACALDERYDFITVEAINLWTNPDKIRSYREKNGEKISIDSMSVIIDSGDDFTVLAMSNFFVLDDDDYIMSYDGCERLCASIMWTLADEHPRAYFTTNHGEISTESFSNMLIFMGYELSSVDLYSDELEGDNSLLIIANPIYDFEKSAEGSAYLAEIDKIERFVKKGGDVMVLIGNGAESLKNLTAMLSRLGMTVNDALVRDVTGGITVDGYSITTEYSDDERAAGIISVASFDDGRVVMRDVAPITIQEVEGVSTYPLLLSGHGSVVYADGVLVDDSGNYTLAAMAEVSGGGKVFLSSADRFATYDTIETNSYTNEEFLYGVFEAFKGDVGPVDFDLLVLDTENLEDLTRGEANLYAVIFIGVVPVIVAIIGAAVCIRRRYR